MLLELKKHLMSVRMMLGLVIKSQDPENKKLSKVNGEEVQDLKAIVITIVNFFFIDIDPSKKS